MYARLDESSEGVFALTAYTDAKCQTPAGSPLSILNQDNLALNACRFVDGSAFGVALDIMVSSTCRGDCVTTPGDEVTSSSSTTTGATSTTVTTTTTTSTTTTTTTTPGPLALDCVRNITVGTNASVSTATVQFPGAQSGLSVSYTPPSGATFALGTTAVLMEVERLADGARANCTFHVIVVDREKPTFTLCPATQTVTASTTNTGGQRGEIVVWNTPTATDNVDGRLTATLSHPSGSFFPVGSTTVVAVARDSAGNAGACDFRINVRAAPLVFQPANVTVSLCGRRKKEERKEEKKKEKEEERTKKKIENKRNKKERHCSGFSWGF